MLKIKKLIFTCIDLIKKFLFFGNFSQNELNGFISNFSKFKFLPYSSVIVPFSLGRTIRGVSFDKNFYLDPYGKLCNDISSNVSHKIIYENLYLSFEKEINLSAADIIRLRNDIKLKKYPAWAIVMPWEKITVEEKFNSYPEIFYRNRRLKGLAFENSSRQAIIDEMHSSRSLESKINQMKKLYESINKSYTVKQANMPKINILIKDNEWRWFMGDDGNHRSYILSLINHEFFNARVNSIINKNNAKNWHNVRNGTYSIKDAEEIFDSFFHGSHVLRGVI
jgi:hypothetical protein